MDVIPNSDTGQKLENVLVGDIPYVVLETAKTQGIDPKEIWGMYLSPTDPRNPKPGTEYLGLANITRSEVLERIDKEQLALNGNDSLQSGFKKLLLSFETQSSENLDVFIQTGLKAIKTHELTHRDQIQNLSYTSVILRTLGPIQNERASSKINAIFSARNNVVLLAEVQALAAQTFTEGVNEKSLLMFNQYWFSKTFALFNQRLSNGGSPDSERWVDGVFSALSGGGDFDHKIINSFGLVSRALFLFEDPHETLIALRAGTLGEVEFDKKIASGLEKVIDSDLSYLSTKGRALFLGLQQPLEQSVTHLVEILDNPS